MFYLLKSIVDVLYGEGWESSKAWKEESFLVCLGSDNRCYNGFYYYWKKNCPYIWLVVRVFWPDMIVRVRLGTTTLKYERIAAQGFRCWVLIWGYMSLSLACVVQVCALPDSWEKGARRCAPHRGGAYFGIFCFRLICVPAVWRMRMAELWQSTVPYLPNLFRLRP